MQKYLENWRLADAGLISNSIIIPVHKVILVSCSEYFDDLFSKECDFIVLKDKRPVECWKVKIEPKQLEALLQRSYGAREPPKSSEYGSDDEEDESNVTFKASQIRRELTEMNSWESDRTLGSSLSFEDESSEPLTESISLTCNGPRSPQRSIIPVNKLPDIPRKTRRKVKKSPSVKDIMARFKYAWWN